MDDRNHRDSNFVTGLILGALVGAGLAIFLVGDEETKEKLKKKGKIALDNLGDLVAELEEKGEKFSQKAKKFKKELEEKTKDAQKEVVEETREKLTHIDELRERGRKATRRFFTKAGKKLA